MPVLERRFAVSEIQIPHPHEARVEPQGVNVGEAIMKTLAPLVQRPRVVRADLLRVVQRQPADARQRGEDLGHRGELGSREDALGDPAWRVQVFGKAPVIDGDGLHQHRAVRRQQPIAGPEEFVVMLQPDRLEHLDADNLVEACRAGRDSPRTAESMRRPASPASAISRAAWACCSALIVVVVTWQP